MNWASSGIQNVYEFELVDVRDLDTSYGYLDGVISATITEDLESDCLSSLKLEFDGSFNPNLCVRVWHTAILGNEKITNCLGTFVQDSTSENLKYGRDTSSISLYSTLMKLTSDLRSGNRGVSGAQLAGDWFDTIVQNAGGTPFRSPNTKNNAFGVSHVWEDGESVFDEALRCAEACDADIRVDALGQIILKLKQEPSSMTPSFNLTSDIIIPGINKTNESSYNRVVASFQDGQKTYYASASAPINSEKNFLKVGRNITLDVFLSALDGQNPQQVLQNYANDLLNAELAKGSEFSLSTLYFPVELGNVGILEYVDGDITIQPTKVQLVSREIYLNTAMTCDLTLREVKND